MSKTVFHSKVMFAICILSTHFVEAALRNVDSVSNDPSVTGTLPFWLLNANDGDTIDCSSIDGQTITLSSSLPAITKSYTINGAGITIDGDSSYQAFQVASGNILINNITVQNAISKGGDGGDGESGGGGAVGGGGALYVHGEASVTLMASSLINNIAQGGNGGTTDINDNGCGGGGGGFGGGQGGIATIVSAGGGGGGHSNGGIGGGIPSVNGVNGIYFGGGGGAAGINGVAAGGTGGNAGPTGAFLGGTQSGGNGGGGAGNSADGTSATGGTGTLGMPGNGGTGIGADFFFGGGGGGGGASESGNSGGAGFGAAGGGAGGGAGGNIGGLGGILGGGGGGCTNTGGNGGFGAGGGGAVFGGTGGGGFGAGGGNGASDQSGNGAGGGGSGLGGAIFIQSNALLTIKDALQISGNTAIAGIGGSTNSTASYTPPGDGAAMGQDIFMRQGSSLTFDLSNTLTISTPIEGDSLTTPIDDSGSLVKRGIGILKLNGTNTYVGQTTIEQGTLQLNGSILEDLLISINGKLSGNATVQGSIHNNGTISPGNSIGTVFTTDLILSSTSIYTVEIDPSNANLIDASGTATIAGKVKVVQDPGNYPAQNQYTILTAAGGLSGSINSLEVQGLPYFQFSLEQDTHNLYLVYIFLPPPSNVRGKQIKEQFLSQTEFINVITWNPPVGGFPPVVYNVYRNNFNTLIGEVPANGKLEFLDHNRLKNVTYTYYIVAIDSQNRRSFPAEITIRPN